MHERRVRRGSFGMWEQSPPSPRYYTPAADLAAETKASLDRIDETEEEALRVLRERLDRGEISGAEERQQAEQIRELVSNSRLAVELRLAVQLDELKRIDEDCQAGRYEL